VGSGTVAVDGYFLRALRLAVGQAATGCRVIVGHAVTEAIFVASIVAHSIVDGPYADRRVNIVARKIVVTAGYAISIAVGVTGVIAKLV